MIAWFASNTWVPAQGVTAEVYWSEGGAQKSVVVKSRRIMERF